MIAIDRGKLRRAFLLAGWLDTQTGEVILANARMESDGIYRYQIDSAFLDCLRYTRLPSICDVQALIAFLEHMDISEHTLEKYDIDTNAFKSNNPLRYAVEREQVSYSKNEYEFLDNVHRLKEDLNLDDEQFSERYEIGLMEKWCKDKGYSFRGSWDL